MQKMSGSWALITGASSGIGKEFAIQLAKHGLSLLLVARRKERLEQIAQELKEKYQIQVELIPSDLTQENACQEVFEKATASNRKVQVLINNAGCGQYGPFLNSTLDEYLKTINLNIVALTKLTYLFSKHMSEHKLESYITNIASIGAYQAVPHFGVYCGTKRYVLDFSETLNHEFQGTNIHICCVSPGGTYTEFMDASGQTLKKMAHTSMMKTNTVVSIALKSMDNKRSSVITGFTNNLFAHFPRFLPARWAMRISHFFFSLAVSYKEK